MKNPSLQPASAPQEPEEAVIHSPEKEPVWFIALVFLVLLTVVGLFLMDWLFSPQKFRMDAIEVRGQLEQVDPSGIPPLVEKEMGGNYFTTRLRDIEDIIRSYPGVVHVSVRRRWPNTLDVFVEEVRPAAVWNTDRFLDATGALATSYAHERSFPELVGPEHMKDSLWKTFQKWQGMFSATGLSLDRLEFDEREIWYLTVSLHDEEEMGQKPEQQQEQAEEGDPVPTVDTGTEITLIGDIHEAEVRIRRLLNAFNGSLLADFPGMRSIDLRYPNGFAIQWVNGSPRPSNIASSN